MNRSLPPDTPASAARRRCLYLGWDTESALSTRLSVSADQIATWRQSGRVLAVWIPEQGRYRFPSFQWRDGALIAEMAPLLRCLREQMLRGGPSSGWEELEWLLAPHALLEGRSPAEALATDPPQVLRLAIQEFYEDPDARW